MGIHHVMMLCVNVVLNMCEGRVGLLVQQVTDTFVGVAWIRGAHDTTLQCLSSERVSQADCPKTD